MNCYGCHRDVGRGPARYDAIATPDGILCRRCANERWPGGAPDR